MTDEWEKTQGLNPLLAGDARQDADGDRLTNLQEFLLGRDPRKADDLNTVFVPQQTTVFTRFDAALIRGGQAVDRQGNPLGGE